MHWHADAVQAGRAGGKAGYLDGWKTGCTRAEQPWCKAAQHAPTSRNASSHDLQAARWGGAAVWPLRSSTCAMAAKSESRLALCAGAHQGGLRDAGPQWGVAAWRAVAAARRQVGAGQWRPPPVRVPQAAAGRSGQPFIPRISGVGSVRGSEGGVHGTGMMHCHRSLGHQQPAGQAEHACSCVGADSVVPIIDSVAGFVLNVFCQ